MTNGIVLSVLSAVAQQERITLSERTKAGLQRAKRAGRTLGRRAAEVDLARVEAIPGRWLGSTCDCHEAGNLRKHTAAGAGQGLRSDVSSVNMAGRQVNRQIVSTLERPRSSLVRDELCHLIQAV